MQHDVIAQYTRCQNQWCNRRLHCKAHEGAPSEVTVALTEPTFDVQIKAHPDMNGVFLVLTCQSFEKESRVIRPRGGLSV